MTALYTTLPSSFRVLGGKANAVSSVQKYFKDMLPYTVYYDLAVAADVPTKRQYPCVVIEQLDLYTDPVSFLGDNMTNGDRGHRERLMMYFRCIVNGAATGVSKQDVRIMRDQIVFVLTHAGVWNEAEKNLWFDPIYLWNYNVTPIVKTAYTIDLEKSEGALNDKWYANPDLPHLFQYDVMARFKYIAPN